MKKLKLDIAPKTIFIIFIIITSIFFLISIILCLIGGLVLDDTEASTSNVKIVTVKVTEAKETTVKTTKEPQETINNIESWKVAYYETYSEFFYKIDYLEKETMFCFYPNKEMKLSILELSTTQDENLINSWYNMLEGFKEVTKENKHTIAIINPYNTENIIMLVDNGKVLYSEF